jgi:hypothetical protein
METRAVMTAQPDAKKMECRRAATTGTTGNKIVTPQDRPAPR